MTSFNYIFYRLAKFFYKRDGIGVYRAIAFLSLLQVLIVIDIIGFALQAVYSLDELSQNSKTGGYISMAIAGILLFFNQNYYKNRYWRFADRWRNKETPIQKFIRSIGVLFAFLIPIIIFLYLGTAAHRQ